MAIQVSSLTATQVAARKRAGRWFVWSGKVYDTKRAMEMAKAAAGSNPAPVARGGGRGRGGARGGRSGGGGRPNTSALFWSAHPGAREQVERVWSLTQATAAWADYKGVFTLYSSEDDVGVPLGASMPGVGELNELQLVVRCGPLRPTTLVQVIAVVVEEVTDLDNITWDVAVELDRKLTLTDVRSLKSVHKIPVPWAVNSGGDARSASLVVLVKAVDSIPADTAQVRFDLVAKCTTLKAIAGNAARQF